MPQNPPNRIGAIPTLRLGCLAPAVTAALAARLLAERERWPLWLPVLMGLGIAVYFALPAEPADWAGAAVFLAAAAAAVVARRRPGVLLAAIGMAAVALGFAAAQGRTARVALPVLERPSGAVVATGMVEQVEPRAGGSQRVTLSDVALDGLDGPVPPRIRIGLRPGAAPVTAGDRLSVRVLLTPPPQPVMPGAFDFARHAWFLGLGAVGRAIGPAEILPPSGELGWADAARLGLGAFRQAVTARVVAALPGSEGGVAAALIAGETAGIPQELLDAYRDSGLAHLLSISGLHMSLVAGLVFMVVRGALALVPAVALRHPIKKWAAAVAMAATFGYMLMAGAPVPTQRAFLMTGIVLVAVMLDRQAISMRLVAWAAVVVLVLAPETLIGPSFQMSFAAVVALIAAYELAAPRLAAWRAGHRGPMAAVGLYVGGVVFSTLIAGSATAVYGIFHFNRFAVFSVVANLAAVPLTGFLVMPFALVALLLMPLGLEAVALVPMGWGVAAVNRVATGVASWPGAALTVPVLPVWGLAVFTFGGAWLCLWRTRWRRWGAVAMAAGLASMAFDRPPDLLVEGRGKSFAVRMADGSLLVQKGGRILKETWDRRAGPLAEERWPKKSRSNDGRLACDPLGCIWRADGRVVALVLDDDGVAAACDSAAKVVLSAVPVRQACRGAVVVVDRFDLWRRGAHALWVGDDGRVGIETVSAWQGDRPWSYRPVRRKKKKEAEDAGAPPKDDGDDGD